jgi:hypothetical protein
MKFKKRVWIIVIISVLLISIFLFVNPFKTGKAISSGNQEVRVIPLSQEERQKVAQVLITSEFIKDVPENYPIALSFFSFEGNERVWRDSFLIGEGTLLSQGTPTIYLSLHAKYISEFNGNNFCEIIQTASKNGDLGFDSEYNTASLFLRYAGMLKYRDCFGF